MVFSISEIHDLKLITIQQQRILIICYQDGLLSFGSQDIYKNERSFNLALQELVHANIVSMTAIAKDDKLIKSWKLTLNGILLVEEVLLDFLRCNNGQLQNRENINNRGVSPHISNRGPISNRH